MKAAEQGEGDVVQILADDGASLDLKDDEGADMKWFECLLRDRLGRADVGFSEWPL